MISAHQKQMRDYILNTLVDQRSDVLSILINNSHYNWKTEIINTTVSASSGNVASEKARKEKETSDEGGISEFTSCCVTERLDSGTSGAQPAQRAASR